MSGYRLNDETNEIWTGNPFSTDFRPVTHSNAVELRWALLAGRTVNFPHARWRQNERRVTFRHASSGHDDNSVAGSLTQLADQFHTWLGRFTLATRQYSTKTQFDNLFQSDECIQCNIKCPYVINKKKTLVFECFNFVFLQFVSTYISLSLLLRVQVCTSVSRRRDENLIRSRDNNVN